MSLSTQLVAKGKRQFALETCKSKREGSPVQCEHCSEHKQAGRSMCPHIVHRTKSVLQDNGCPAVQNGGAASDRTHCLRNDLTGARDRGAY
jgi:hypothetical protein